MSNEMPTTVRLTAEQKQKLGEIALEWGCGSHSEVIARFVDSWSSDVVKKAVVKAALPAKLPPAPRYKVLADFQGSVISSGVRIPIQLHEGVTVERELYPSGHLEELYRQGAQLQPL
jgi:hypothetical protein